MSRVNLLFVLIATVAISGCEKYALDRRMEGLCRKDGGVTVYERVVLPANRFDSDGRIISIHKNPPDFEGVYGSEFRLLWSMTVIKDGNPVLGQGRLIRSEHKLVRVFDGKILAISVAYGRSGGDLVPFPHFSSKVCPSSGDGESMESVFIKGE